MVNALNLCKIYAIFSGKICNINDKFNATIYVIYGKFNAKNFQSTPKTSKLCKIGGECVEFM